MIKIARVNCEVEETLCDYLNVDDFPSLRLYEVIHEISQANQ